MSTARPVETLKALEFKRFSAGNRASGALARDLIQWSVMDARRHVRREVFMKATSPLIDGLYGAAVRLSGSRAEADDLVQETLLSAWQSWDRFEEGTNLRAWLHRIMVNGFITQYRRRKRERRALDVESDPGRRELFLTSSQQSVEGVDGGIQYSGLGRSLRDALDALPVEFRAVIVMADLCEMTYREIADELGCPIGTVMSRLHRARRAVAARVEIDAPEAVPVARSVAA